ncbi:prolyl oligopeptidase family serine peptidase [Streptomyces sp. TG1A-8]|uniref:prolyl oligopeptidase family serine peptidase n=1 Tax=Streptomyces sp. TG1A-8 TaxID=3051385 RepID=UPI00265C6F99|nr:prolyl oligopeptidase family serine peptidase [Streptomyces sp. TG1A-8]MDO0924417.1 prolyl oligopeptidase family serine peptidase [Streptomyces sp. TG1A-8]
MAPGPARGGMEVTEPAHHGHVDTRRPRQARADSGVIARGGEALHAFGPVHLATGPDGGGAAAIRAAPEPVHLADTAAPYDVPQPLVAHGCWYPSVDPGGRHVAFICDRTGVPQLWAGPVDGGQVRLLDADPEPVTEVSWSPDGRWIAYTTAPGGGELTRVLCVRPDGTGRRLLAGGEPGTSAHLGCWTHDGSALAVTVREPGPAVLTRDGPDAPTASADPQVPVRTRDWTGRAGRAVLLGGTALTTAPHPVHLDAPAAGVHPPHPGAVREQPGPRTLTAYLVDPEGEAAPVLLASEPGAPTLRVCDVSRDGRLALLRRGPRGNREALVVRGADRTVTCAVRVADGDPWIGGFSPDGRTLWLRSDSGREYAALLAVRLGPRGQQLDRTVAAARPDCDLELLALDREAHSAVLCWNVRGVSELEVAALAPAAPERHGADGTRRPGAAAGAPGQGPPVPAARAAVPAAVPDGTGTRPAAPVGAADAHEPPGLPPDLPLLGPSRAVALPHEVVVRAAPGFGPDGPVVALSGSRRRPGVWWLPQGAALRTPWSSRDEEQVPDGRPPVRPVPLRPLARDGLALGGWYYRAPGRSPGEPAPCVLHLHGGPEEQERPVLEPLYHELLGRGLDVFAPDIRGSSGYGRSFVDADLGEGRFAAIEDVAACAAHVVVEGMADPRRLAVMGRSYGGYLVMASLVWHPELFRTGVAVCGMSDLHTFFAGTEPWIAESAAHKYGHPERDRDLLRDLSPMSRIDALRVPVLTVHGEHDTNVPPGESEQFVRAARERGLEAELLLLREEGHDFRRADNRRLFRRTAADWIQRHLAD